MVSSGQGLDMHIPRQAEPQVHVEALPQTMASGRWKSRLKRVQLREQTLGLEIGFFHGVIVSLV